MEAQRIGAAQQLIHRQRAPIHRLDGPLRLEAAVVVVVVDEQTGTRRHHRRQHVEVGEAGKVGRQLLLIADIFNVEDTLPERRMPRYRRGGGDARVQAGEQDRLPTAPGAAGHRHPRPVHPRQVKQDIQRALHDEVKDADAVHPAGAELRQPPVPVGNAKLPHAQELVTQGDDAALRQIDTAHLLHRQRVARGVMPLGVEHGGQMLTLQRLIQQRRRPQAGIPFIAQLADAVPLTRLYRLLPLHRRRCLQQPRRMPGQEQRQHLPPRAFGDRVPGIGRCRRFQLRQHTGEIRHHLGDAVGIVSAGRRKSVCGHRIYLEGEVPSSAPYTRGRREPRPTRAS
ncbi:MAG: hypothetical protein BWY76_02435 [bacterium ADurb.Bin429]|nr:MAG: hypothetical protein BWY76_02435 [bacterium ADurb.Bin429]